MNTEEIKSIKELFNVKFEALEKRMEDVKNEITNISSKQQTQIDVHCQRIRNIEAEQQRNKTKTEVNATKIAAIIGSIIFIIIFAFDRLANWIDSIIGG